MVKPKLSVETSLAQHLRKDGGIKEKVKGFAEEKAAQFSQQLDLERQFRIDANIFAKNRELITSPISTVMRLIAPTALRNGKTFVLRSALKEVGFVKNVFSSALYFNVLALSTAASIIVESFAIGPLKFSIHNATKKYLADPFRAMENPEIARRLGNMLGMEIASEALTAVPTRRRINSNTRT